MIKGYFSTANKIRHTPKELFEEGYRFVLFDVDSKQDQTYTKGIVWRSYRFVLFDVESLFAPPALDRIYNKKLLKTNMKKRTMNRLLEDCCIKNVMTFNNVLYEQIAGVSMGSYLRHF